MTSRKKLDLEMIKAAQKEMATALALLFNKALNRNALEVTGAFSIVVPSKPFKNLLRKVRAE